MALLNNIKERAKALEKRVFHKKNTRTVQFDGSGSSSAALVVKEAVEMRDSNVATGPSAAVPKDEQPTNSTVAGSSDIARAVGKQLSHSASAKRLRLSSDSVVSQVNTPTSGGQSLDGVISTTLASATCPDDSDQVQPIWTDVGSHPPQEEPLRSVESAFESPYMKLTIQSLEDKDKKGYEQLTDNQLGGDGAEQIMSQF